MYSCSRCKSDVTAEVERIIAGIVSSSAPGQSKYPNMKEYFEQRYECRDCSEHEHQGKNQQSGLSGHENPPFIFFPAVSDQRSLSAGFDRE